MFKKIVGQLWKVATGYIVFCVASIQLISVLSDNIEFEETLGFSSAAIIQFTFFAAPIGLPLILIFAYLLQKSHDSAVDQDALYKDQISLDKSYKKKIAVIPFENLNKDDDGAFLVDGIVEDLITEFSMIKEIEILSRQTCFDYRNKNYSLEEYKDKFDVDYIVSGSMRSLNERLRISVELSEMDEGNIIWGNKFELDKDDIFDVQDEIVRKTIISLLGNIELQSLERANRIPTDSMTSYECLLKGKDYHHRFTKEDNQKALDVLEKAIQADEHNSQAHAWKACVLGQALGRGYLDNTDQLVEDIIFHIDLAVKLNKNDFEAHRMLAEVHLSMHSFEEAKLSGMRAFQLKPNDPRVTSVYGEALLRNHQVDEGIDFLLKAYELDPIPQGQTTSDRRVSAIYFGYYLKNDLENAELFFNKIMEMDFRSWLLNIHLKSKHEIEFKNLNWYQSNLQKFNNLDFRMEIDRFHLNNPDLQSELQALAEQHL